jgi:quercetin dioxygenase-like cupin family protein
MAANLIKIKAKQKLLALVIKKEFPARAHQFLTEEDNPLQLGILKYAKGQSVKPHLHRQIEKTSHKNQEFIYVVSGQVRVSFFYRREKIKSLILNRGDILLQLSGGHGFEMLKSTELITIKQGPYHGTPKEKTFI